MDFIRTCYTTYTRLWQNDPTETRIRWFRCEPGALVVPQPNQYVSSSWDDAKDPGFPPVGELVAQKHVYDKGANPLGYLGQSFFGDPSAWANGGIHGESSATVTDATGSCPTCFLPNLGADGGVGLGGSALFPEAPFGSVLWGGRLGNIDAYEGGPRYGGNLADIDSFRGGTVYGGQLGPLTSFMGGFELGGDLNEIDSFEGGVEYGGFVQNFASFSGGFDLGGSLGPLDNYEGGPFLGGNLGNSDSFRGGVDLGGNAGPQASLRGGTTPGGSLGNIDPYNGGAVLGGDIVPVTPSFSALEGGVLLDGGVTYEAPPPQDFAGGVLMGGSSFMQGQLTNYAGLGADDSSVGSVAWNNPTNIEGIPSGLYADVTVGVPFVASHYLVATDFGLAVPSGSTITGVMVTFIRRNNGGGFGFLGSMTLWQTGGPIGTAKSDGSPFPSVFTPASYGGNSDLWGVGLTPADVNDPSFGVAIVAENITGSVEVDVEAVEIIVYYS